MAPLKVLHVVEATFAGVGRHVQDLVEHQLAAGHELHVVYSARREEATFARRREALSGACWHRVDTGNLPGPADLRIVARVRSIAVREGVDIVHGHSTKGGLLARLAGLGSAHRIVYTPNAFYTMNPMLGSVRRRVVASLEAALARCTDAIVAVSPEEREHALSLGMDAARLYVIPNGVARPAPVDGSIVRRELGLPEGVPCVGFVGRLDAQKSPLDVVRVYTQVSRARPDVRFALVGTGPMQAELRAAIDAAGASAGCLLLGHRPGQRAMAAFDAFLLPSRYEGFPYVLVEAAMSGLPIVTTKAAGASSLVVHGETGFVHRAGDIEGMANSVLALLDDPVRLAAFGAAQAARSTHFTLTGMGDAVEALYRKLTSAATPESTL